jgi:hypothetical protein
LGLAHARYSGVARRVWRYVIPKAVQADWASRHGRMATLTAAQGLLGAAVVNDCR